MARSWQAARHDMGNAVGDLRLNLLGALEVVRDGQAVPLPPSKKTRALLAYVAMKRSPVRREFLCEMLWDVPDDPRGSLRWSLSKLRRIVDDDDHARIVANRDTVDFDAATVRIDVLELHALAGSQLESASLETLEDAATRYRGNFLEGLELPNSFEFHTWCVGERELAVRSYTAVLRTLVERLIQTPHRAMPHARRLAAVAPYEESVHATLIRILVALRRHEEAELHYQMARRMLEEVDMRPSQSLYQAWRGLPGVSIPRDGTAPAPPVHSGNGVLVAPSHERTSNTLVGRDVERAQLAAVLASVIQQRRAAFVLMRGDPGIGKTRLLQDLATLARQSDARLIEACAFETETMRPLGPWIDALRADSSGAASAVFKGSDYDNRERLFEALSDFVGQESLQRPVVLLFDDLQWCDESSAAALHYIARMNRQRPLLGLLAGREDELRDNAAVQQALRGLLRDGVLQELKLEPLSDACVRQLIEEREPQVDSDQLSKACSGNPLLAIELSRAMAAGETGSSLEELIRDRLARLGEIGGEILSWAAVLSPHINVAVLLRVTGFESLRIGEALEAAERQAILRSGERGIRFTHDLIARAVYSAISPARRRVMHRRVTELLAQETALDLSHAADLAHHARHSGDPELAARAMVSAGRLCLRFFANDDAFSAARIGLQLAAQLPDALRVPLTIDLRDIMLTAAPVKDWESAASEYVALAEQALDHGALSHARLGYHMASYVRWMHGHWSSAREGTLQAERVTRGASDEEHIVGMAETARCLALLERDMPQADAMSMEAHALAQRKNMHHRAIPAALGMLRYHQNKLQEAEELFQEARTLCKTAGDRVNEYQAIEHLVMIDFERREFAKALQRCAALVTLGDKLREGSEAPFARALEGLCTYALHDETSQLEGALDELRIADAKHRLAYTLTRAALFDVERGRQQKAIMRAREALGYAEALERGTERLLAHVVLAHACRAMSDEHEYERHVAAVAALSQASVARWAQNHASTLMSAGGP